MIPETYSIDFSAYKQLAIERGLSRLLDQFYSSCVLRQLVAVFLSECRELQDAILGIMEQRTLYNAEGEILNGIGRIVGEPRTPYSYDDSKWMFSDRAGQGVDQSAVWCIGAPFEAFIPVLDDEYRRNILAQIRKNHTLCASVPELTSMAPDLTGYDVSFEKTGPMQVRIFVSSSASNTALALLTRKTTDATADDKYAMPYPATLDILETVIFTPKNFFCADRQNPQGVDSGPCAVGSVSI